jgi:hypothetical protein
VAQKAAPGTKLCNVVPGVNGKTGNLECPKGDFYVGGTVGGLPLPGTPGEISSAAGTITCTLVKLIGSFDKNGQPNAGGGITTYSMETKGGKCTSNYAGGNPEVTVTWQNLAYSNSMFSYSGLENPQGQFGIQGAAKKPVELKLVIHTATPATCEYDRRLLVGHVVNDVDGKGTSSITIGGSFRLRTENPAGKGVCPAQQSPSTALTFQRPDPPNPDKILYITAE